MYSKSCPHHPLAPYTRELFGVSYLQQSGGDLLPELDEAREAEGEDVPEGPEESGNEGFVEDLPSFYSSTLLLGKVITMLRRGYCVACSVRSGITTAINTESGEWQALVYIILLVSKRLTLVVDLEKARGEG